MLVFHQSLRFSEGVFSETARENQGSMLFSIHAKVSVPDLLLYMVFLLFSL